MSARRLAILLTGIFLWASVSLATQDAPRAAFTTVRRVQIPASIVHPEIVVSEFATHGELRPEGTNLSVSTSTDKPVSWSVLQVGPGDFCRIAFQTVPKANQYLVHYGGNPVAGKAPPWTATAGLLLETREWKRCNLNDRKAVETAFASAAPIGSDFVPNVFHGFNPFWPAPEPFLSRYQGTLFIKTEGKYSFFTSSQDCSFLSIDDKEVVAAPGTHGPVNDARIRGEVYLTAGPHAFRYSHAASVGAACMVGAWQQPGGKPEIIPAEAFHSQLVAHLTPGRAQHGTKGVLRDFVVEILGEAPLPDVDSPLIRVQFHELRPVTAPKLKTHWSFGDGQVSDDAEPIHVYLHHGLFIVKLGDTSCKVYIHRGHDLPQAKKANDRLIDYEAILAKYNSLTLDPLSALQLMRFADHVGQRDRAVNIGKTWLLAKAPPADEAVVFAMAQMIGPSLRDRLDDPRSAFEVWNVAAGVTRTDAWKATCELEAADLCLHELLKRAETKRLLDSTTLLLAKIDQPVLAGKLHRLWGDWHTRGGDSKAARAAYAKAAAVQGGTRSSVEREARRGAFGRSVEAFLRDKALDRAGEELRRWQDEFPQDKIDGYLSLLLARFQAARGKHQLGLLAVKDLLTINPESPYADQVAFLGADCEEQLGRLEQARAAFQALVVDYPGSPLVRDAKLRLVKLTAGK